MKKLLPLIFSLAAIPATCQSFYDLMEIQEIQIFFPFSNWDYQLDTAKAGAEGYLLTDSVVVNGETFIGAGVKYKGNSSYDPNYSKNPLHVKLDFTGNDTYHGIEDIKLGNGWSDNSMIREPLAYQILRQYMDAPQGNFAKVYINGAYYGLMNNAEDIGSSFLKEHYRSSKYEFFKCNSDFPGQGLGNGPDLGYFGNNIANYEGKYELKSDTGWSQLVQLCDTLNNHFAHFYQMADVDRFLWMLAFNNVLVNLDSYTGAFRQNYYLYRNHQGQWIPTIWDLNMCFGGFPSAGGIVGAMTPVGMRTMSHTLHKTEEDWPLIQKLLNDPFYAKMYYAHMRTINQENFANGSYKALAMELHNLVDSEVQNDPNFLTTYANFQVSLDENTNGSNNSGVSPGIFLLMDNRASYLNNVLSAAPPVISQVQEWNATTFGQTASITALVENATAAYLGYRMRSTDRFLRVPMADDGLHNDGIAGDNIFGADLPLQSLQIQYYIYAENAATGAFLPARAEYNFFTITPAIVLAEAGDIVLNEFTANNKTGLENEMGKNRDWVEVFNTTDQYLGLSGLYLTNLSDNLTKWPFPDNLIIKPKEHLLIWADDLDETYIEPHTNFNLNKDGDILLLTNGTEVLNAVQFDVQANDAAEGRCPDGVGPFVSVPTRTPAAVNDCSNASENPQTALFLAVQPNPTTGLIQIETELPEINVEVFGADGQNLLRSKSAALDLGAQPPGVYFMQIRVPDGRLFMARVIKL